MGCEVCGHFLMGLVCVGCDGAFCLDHFSGHDCPDDAAEAPDA